MTRHQRATALRALRSTASWTAASRARESQRRDALFVDPLAREMAGDDGFEWQRAFEDSPDGPVENAFLPIRTRFVDDFLRRTVHEGAIRQVVLVAAGFDTRALRMIWPSGTVLYELDQPDVLAVKQDVIATRDAPLTCERRPIGVDLEDDCAPALLHGGFDPDAPTAWIVEGFTPYLDPAQVDRLLERIGSLAAPGSRLAMDMLDLRFFEQPWSQRDLALVRERGVPWRFGTDDPAGLLERHGWCAEITRPGQPGADFGRWPHPDALVYLVVADRR